MQFNWPVDEDKAQKAGEGAIDTTKSQSHSPPPKRKPYTPPKLTPWGTLRDVTRSVGSQGASDGGNKNRRGTRG